MSITLGAADTIRGVAGSATSITYTIYGDQVSAGADAFDVLAQGQLPSTIGTLYTVPASTMAIIKAIHLANPTAGAVTAKLAVNGTADANVILPAATILAGGLATYDGRWTFYNDQGQVLGVGATGATGAAGQGVPAGGTAGQRLAKIDGTDYNTEWVSATGETEILNIPTAETDTALVLAPDGAGGVEFRAETGGGGGGSGASRLGKTSTGASAQAMVGNRAYCKRITIPGAGTLISVAARIAAPSAGQVLRLGHAVWADNAGVVGQLLGISTVEPMYLQTDGGGTIPDHLIHGAVGARFEASGFGWIGARWDNVSTAPNIRYDTGGSDRYFDSTSYFATGGTVFAQTDSTRNFDLYGVFLPD